MNSGIHGQRNGNEPLGNIGIGDSNMSGNLDWQSIGRSTEPSHAHIDLSASGTIASSIFPAICDQRFVIYRFFFIGTSALKVEINEIVQDTPKT